MDHTALVILVGIAASGLTTAVTFGRNPRDPINRAFLLWGAASWLWGAGTLLRTLSDTEPNARLCFTVAMFGAMGTIAIYLVFTLLFLDRAVGGRVSRLFSRLLPAAAIVSGLVLFAFIPFSPWVAIGFLFDGGASRVVVGWGFHAIVVWGMAVTLLGAATLLGHLRRIAEPRVRKQALTVIAAPLAPAAFFAVAEFLFGATQSGALLGESYTATVIVTLVIAFGIMRYGLMLVTPETAASQILAALPDGVALVDIEGKIRSANRALLAMVGREEDAVLGRPVWDLLTGQETAERTQARTGSSTRLDFQVGVRPPSGEMIPVSATYEPILDPGGEAVGSIVVLRDQRPLRRLQTELIRAEKLAGLGELVAGVAHEFNSPLTVILGTSDLALRKGGDPATLDRFRRISEEAVRARDIVSKLLQFARQGESHRAKADLNLLLAEAAELTEFDSQGAGIRLDLRLPDAPLEVLGNATEIRQVFQNLVQNAVQALRNRPDPGTVRITAEGAREWAIVRVDDDGPGIAPEVLPRVFDPFFTTKEIGQGTGLGLSICHGIVQEHKGRIRAEESSLGGARFVVELPLARG